MIKSLLSIALTLAFFLSNAQITLDSADLFQAGDKFDMMTGKNPAIIDVKGTGASSWDFSKLTTNTVVKVSTRKPNTGSFPIDSMFPDASTVFNHQVEGTTYLIKRADSMFVDGILDFDFALGVKVNINFEPNLTYLKFPFTYQNTISTSTTFDTIVDTTILIYDKLRITSTITYNSEAEAHGNLKTVHTTYNTLKVYSEEVTKIIPEGRNMFTKKWETLSTYIQIDTVHRYRWFAKGEGYQVAEAVADEKNGTCTQASYLLSNKIFAYISESGNPSCFGKADGFAEVKAVGGSGTRTVVWSTSAGSQATFKATNLAAGKHFVTVTDVGNGSTFVDSVTLISPDSMTIKEVSKIDETTAGNDGSIEIVVTGGSSPYTYKWDKSSSTTNKAMDLAGGDHTIEVKDSNLCTKSITISIGSTVGINKLNNQEVNSIVKIYPNPASDFVNIKTDGKSNLKIINILGETIDEKIFNANSTIDVSNLSGIYLFQISYGTKAETIRVLIE